MVRKLGLTNKGPGIIRPLIAESPGRGLAIVIEELESFYSPFNNDRGLRFIRSNNIVDSEEGLGCLRINTIVALNPGHKHKIAGY